MKVLEKYKILNLLTTVEEAIKYTEEIDVNKNEDMLNDCIAAIDEITNKLKEENLIEKVYDLVTDIRKDLQLIVDNMEEESELIRKIYNEISDLKYSIVNEIETNFKMVFMPYKVSMWDALESIWECAKDDSCCEAAIVPIPYYELDENRKAKRLCYEGGRFQKELNIVNFEDYNFNDIADVIFIHNPYDGFNKITMVDPKYFSDELKKYTSMLIYVPYYVDGSLEDKVTNQFYGAFKNADYIVAQSKKHKDSYIRAGYRDDKILNLGSPKIDAVMKEMKKESVVPMDWNSKIQGKKVVLLSTGISDLLYDNNFINRLKNIVMYFKNSKECALIWRPHPLTKLTIEDMANENMVVNTYNYIIDQIEETDNIVLDLNNDAYESMRISDALICDYSSILFQYIITEKPIYSIMNKYYFDESRYYISDYSECYFSEKGESLEEFVQMVLSDKDLKKQARVTAFKESITNADGNAGEEIYKFVVEKFNNIFESFLRSDEVVR